MKNSNDFGLLLLRIGFGSLILTHGIPKIEMLSNSPIKFPDPVGLGSTTSLILTLIGEVIAPILIIIGFKTKFATIPATITMFVAAFVVHFSDPLGKKEMAFLYFIAFTVLFFTGPGKYSVDGLTSK